MARQPYRIDSIFRINSRYAIVRASPPASLDGAGIALLGHVNDIDNLPGQLQGIANCKPGVWRAEVRLKDPEVDDGDGDREVCLRWVGPLDAASELDFKASVDEWRAWDGRMRGLYDEVKPLDGQDGVVWKAAGSFFDDGGMCNIVSTEYLTIEAAEAVVTGGGDDAGGEEVDDAPEYYLETLTLNETEEWDRPDGSDGYTLGGIHFGQDAVGGPPRLAVAEKDGQVIAVKGYLDDEELDEGHVFGAEQPGEVKF